MTSPTCPCVACELDRAHGRFQYRQRPNRQWYDPWIGYSLLTEEHRAPLVGPNHLVGRCQRVGVKR